MLLASGAEKLWLLPEAAWVTDAVIAIALGSLGPCISVLTPRRLK